jgi:hypothetical protein
MRSEQKMNSKPVFMTDNTPWCYQLRKIKEMVIRNHTGYRFIPAYLYHSPYRVVQHAWLKLSNGYKLWIDCDSKVVIENFAQTILYSNAGDEHVIHKEYEDLYAYIVKLNNV